MAAVRGVLDVLPLNVLYIMYVLCVMYALHVNCVFYPDVVSVTIARQIVFTGSRL